VIEIVDNGRGIKPDEHSADHSYGIAGMHERAKALGGWVRVHGSNKGTQVLVHMPSRRGGSEAAGVSKTDAPVLALTPYRQLRRGKAS
jgi:nitrate/nitrite-specific signal transduction histidine kinase